MVRQPALLVSLNQNLTQMPRYTRELPVWYVNLHHWNFLYQMPHYTIAVRQPALLVSLYQMLVTLCQIPRYCERAEHSLLFMCWSTGVSQGYAP